MKEEDLPSFGDKGGAEGKRNLKTGKGSEKKKKKLTAMAYRRRQGITRASTFKEEIHHEDSLSSSSPSVLPSSHSFSNSSSLAAQAIRASAAHRESYLGKVGLRNSFY